MVLRFFLQTVNESPIQREENQANREAYLQSIRNDRGPIYRILVFHQSLRHFEQCDFDRLRTQIAEKAVSSKLIFSSQFIC